MTGSHFLPFTFRQRIVGAWNAAGAAWLEQLPEIIDSCSERWALTVAQPFPGLSYHWVAPASTATGEPVVLKLGVPRAELAAEIEVLRLAAGQGTVRLLHADAALGALVLERLLPGTPLTLLADDEEATAIAARLMRQFWRPAPLNAVLPTTIDWMEGFERLRSYFDGGTGPFSPRLIAHVEEIARELHASAAGPVVLHGDLHHYNILAAQRQPWLIIDPQGVVGEPSYEVGAFMRNPMPEILDVPDLTGLSARRAKIFAAVLGLDEQRILGWSFAQAVLSSWWSIEDRANSWRVPLAIAEALQPLV